MKKSINFLFIIFLLVMLTTSVKAAIWITGTVNDAAGEPANDHTAMIYYPGNKTDNETDTIGPNGNSGQDNKYMIDCELLDTPCQVDDIISVEVINSGDGYTAGPVNVTITGAPFEIAPDMTLVKSIVVEINFTVKSIDWGQGSVNSGAASAVLDSFAGTVDNGTWSAQSIGLELENIGTTDAKLELMSDKNASLFIGGGGPEEDEDFEWKIVNTTSSCNETWNSTGFTNVAISYKEMCPKFYYDDSKDNVTMHLKIVIPSYTEKTGAQTAIITAKATEIS